MENPELTAEVVRRLSRSEDPNAIITSLCERNRWTWSEAEAFMGRVQEEQAGAIARRQLPLMTALAFVLFAGGLALMGYSIFTLVGAWNTASSLAGGTLPPLDVFSHLRLVLESGLGPASLFVTGLAMGIGSLTGMRKVWTAILDR